MASALDAVGEQGAEDDNDELSDEGDVGILSPGQRVYFAGNVYVVTSYDQHAGHTLRGTGSLSCVTMVCPDDVYSATGGDPLVVLPGPNAHGDAQDTAEVMTAAAVRSGGDYVGDKHGCTVFESSYLKAGLASLTALRVRFRGRALRARTLLADISVDEMAGVWRTALDIEMALGYSELDMVAIDGVDTGGFHAHELCRRRRAPGYYRPDVPDPTHASPGVFRMLTAMLSVLGCSSGEGSSGDTGAVGGAQSTNKSCAEVEAAVDNVPVDVKAPPVAGGAPPPVAGGAPPPSKKSKNQKKRERDKEKKRKQKG